MATKNPHSGRRVVLAAALAGGLLPGLAAQPAWAGADGEIVYVRSTDGGATFAPAVNLSQDPELSERPRVVAGAGSVHVVWQSGDPGDILYRRSVNGGADFEAPVGVSATQGESLEPDLALSGSTLHLAWKDDFLDSRGKPDPRHDAREIYRRRSTDGGKSFGDRASLSDSPDAPNSDARLAAQGDVVVVVYNEERSDTEEDDAFFRRSTDGGATWDKAANLSADPQHQSSPAVAISGDGVHVVWEDRDRDDTTAERIAYAGSTDGGATFAPPVHLPTDTSVRYPAVAAEGDTVHVAACVPADKTGVFDSELHYWRSTDGGATWSDPVNLSANPGDCKKPTVASGGGRVNVAWADKSPPARTDIFFRRSGDGGASFDPIQNVSNSRGEADGPSLAIDPADGSIHLVWTDFSLDPTAGAAASAFAPAPVPSRDLRRGRRR